MTKKLTHILILAACSALILSAAASGSSSQKTWCFGNVCVADDGGISPKKLPKRGKAPASAQLTAEISTRDGTHPPAFQSMDLYIDRTIEFDSRGLPVCKLGQLMAQTTAKAVKACKHAIVGRGFAEAQVEFPDQTPFGARGPLIVFNGGGKPKQSTVLVHVYANVPAPTAIVTKATISKVKKGRFGMRIQLRVPRIAGGHGSTTEFDLKIGRRYKHRGKKRSLLMAGCPRGVWMAKGQAGFVDGTKIAISHLFRCTPVG